MKKIIYFILSSVILIVAFSLSTLTTTKAESLIKAIEITWFTQHSQFDLLSSGADVYVLKTNNDFVKKNNILVYDNDLLNFQSHHFQPSFSYSSGGTPMTFRFENGELIVVISKSVLVDSGYGAWAPQDALYQWLGDGDTISMFAMIIDLGTYESIYNEGYADGYNDKVISENDIQKYINEGKIIGKEEGISIGYQDALEDIDHKVEGEKSLLTFAGSLLGAIGTFIMFLLLEISLFGINGAMIIALLAGVSAVIFFLKMVL